MTRAGGSAMWEWMVRGRGGGRVAVNILCDDVSCFC